MQIVLLTLEFRLHGCRSLKEKRQRLSGLKEKFGRQPNLAVCESDFHDIHDRAQWSFVAVSTDAEIVERTLRAVENHIEEHVDAVLVDSAREAL